MLRVNHAGEHGAVQIYKGQRAVFEGLIHKERTADALRRMEEGEAAHLETFDRLLADRGVRPTALSPVWTVAGFTLGAATALMGEKAAMAATEAVEEVIEKHYAAQALELETLDPELVRTIAAFRDDELHHKDTAVRLGAREAAGYPVLKALIGAGCRLAIRLSEKI
jgi:ubiquinone biosynthesis monooxygenase Coq7